MPHPARRIALLTLVALLGPATPAVAAAQVRVPGSGVRAEPSFQRPTWRQFLDRTFGRSAARPSPDSTVLASGLRLRRFPFDVTAPDSLALPGRLGEDLYGWERGRDGRLTWEWAGGYRQWSELPEDTARVKVLTALCVGGDDRPSAHNVLLVVQHNEFVFGIQPSGHTQSAWLTTYRTRTPSGGVVEEDASGREYVQDPISVITPKGQVEPAYLQSVEPGPGDPGSGVPIEVRLISAKARDDSTARASERAARQRGQARAARIRAKGWPPEITRAVLAGRVRIGMTPEQVRASWGEPDDINRTTVAGERHEQWVYAQGNYVYLRNGRVTAIQH